MHLLVIDWIFLVEKLILIIVIVSVSLGVAMYSTWGERKVAAFMQDRWDISTAGRWSETVHEGGDLPQQF